MICRLNEVISTDPTDWVQATAAAVTVFMAVHLIPYSSKELLSLVVLLKKATTPTRHPSHPQTAS